MKPIYIYESTLQALLRVRNVSDKGCRKKIKAHILFSNFFPENPELCEIMWGEKMYGRARQATDGSIIRHRY